MSILDTIDTAISLGIFKNREEAEKGISKAELYELPLTLFSDFNVDNFNSNRLQKTATKAYPLKDRLRGKKDISSVKYFLKHSIPPIWLAKKKGRYILIDGSHRIVASYILDKKNIKGYIFKI